MNVIHLKTVRELTPNTEYYCICGEKVCFKDCEVCEILLNDKTKRLINKSAITVT